MRADAAVQRIHDVLGESMSARRWHAESFSIELVSNLRGRCALLATDLDDGHHAILILQLVIMSHGTGHDVLAYEPAGPMNRHVHVFRITADNDAFHQATNDFLPIAGPDPTRSPEEARERTADDPVSFGA